MQLLRGSFDQTTGKYRQFIPVPLKIDWDSFRPLQQAAADVTGDLHGCGVRTSAEGQEEAYLILIEDGQSVRHFGVPGNWIISYRYNDNEGTHSHEVFLAAEVIS